MKANQPRLYQQLITIADSQTPLDMFGTLETNRGRIERRRAEIYDLPRTIQQDWVGSMILIKITRSGKRQQEDNYCYESHYLCSLPLTAEDSILVTRQHWGIENQLHRVKDVQFGEDDSKIKTQNAPINLSRLRDLVINLYHRKGIKNITSQTRQWMNKPELFMQLFE